MSAERVPASGISVIDFLTATRDLSEQGFEFAWGVPLLVELTGDEAAIDNPFDTKISNTADGLRSPPPDATRVTPNSFLWTLVKRQSVFPDRLMIGRTKNNDIAVVRANVSKLHAYFLQVDGEWFVADVGSLNGTAINGTPCEPNEPARLSSGDRVSFGPTACLFLMPADARKELMPSLSPE